MAGDFWERLGLAIKATATSLETRIAELRALEANPDSFVQEGLVTFKPTVGWGRRPAPHVWGQPAYLSGNRDSLKLSCPAGVLSSKHDFVFPRNVIRRLNRFAIAGLYPAMRIEHIQESYPEFILFYASRVPWTSGFEKLRLNLARLGYSIE